MACFIMSDTGQRFEQDLTVRNHAEFLLGKWFWRHFAGQRGIIAAEIVGRFAVRRCASKEQPMHSGDRTDHLSYAPSEVATRLITSRRPLSPCLSCSSPSRRLCIPPCRRLTPNFLLSWCNRLGKLPRRCAQPSPFARGHMQA